MDNEQRESNWANACRARGLVSPCLTRSHEGARPEDRGASEGEAASGNSGDAGVKTQFQQQ
jgi:hypothetical protein